MRLALKHHALYAAFDLFPSAKGSATHINQFSRTLFDHMDGGLLYCLGNEQLPEYQCINDQIEVVRFVKPEPNFIKRSQAFTLALTQLLEQQRDTLRLYHFRDPWSGLAALAKVHPQAKIIYEVNGLPSIEMSHHYPAMHPQTREKFRAAERYCWEKADHVITPSQVLYENLLRLGVAEKKLTMIANGAESIENLPRPVDAPECYILYFGALQKWQGVDVLLRAFKRLLNQEGLFLVICSSNSRKKARIYRKLAERLGLEDRILWHYGLNKEQLGGWITHARLTVAPLTECDRNLEQGCCPLKILESMAYGVPVIASDLPVVRELLTETEGALIAPERPAELARMIQILLESPEKLETMGRLAKQKVQSFYTWDQANQSLREIYQRSLSRQ